MNHPRNPLLKLSLLVAGAGLLSLPATADPYRVDLHYQNGKWGTWQGGVLRAEALNLHWAVQTASAYLTPARTPAQKGMVVVNWDASTPTTYGTGASDLRDVTNVIYDFRGFRVSPQASGACLKATRCHNMEIRNFKASNTGGWGFLLHFVDSHNVLVNNLDLLASSGPFGVRMDGSSATAPMTNPRFTGAIGFRGIAANRHGIETLHVKDFHAATTITGNQLGGCGVLFNHTDGAYIEAMNITDYGLGSPYAAFRTANGSKGNMRITYFRATNGNRGLTTLDSTTQNLTVDRFEINNTVHHYNADGSVFSGSGQGIRLIGGTRTVLGGWNRRSWVRGSAAAGMAVYPGSGQVELLNAEVSGSPSGLGLLLESGTSTTINGCTSTANGNGSRNRAGAGTVVTNSSIDWR